MEVRVADNEKVWNDIVAISPQATAFHQYEWLKTMEKYTGFKFYPLIAFEGEEPVGLFPLFFYKKLLLKSAFSPPPRTATSYLGSIDVERENLRLSQREHASLEFQKSVDCFINESLKANYVYFSAPPGINDPRIFEWLGYEVKPAYGYVTELKNGFETVLEKITTKRIRKENRRGLKRGIVVREGGKKELEVIYDLMLDRYENQDKSVSVSKKYLLDLFDKFNLRIFVAEYEEEIVTGTVCVDFKNRFLSWIGFPKPRIKLSPSPNDLLILEEIKYACENGYNYYEIMGAAGDKRLHRYYSKFNFDIIVRFYAKRTSMLSSLVEKVYLKMKGKR